MTIKDFKLIKEVMNDTYKECKSWDEYGMDFDLNIFITYLIKAIEKDHDNFNKDEFIQEFRELSHYPYSFDIE